jgi:hypothetical protein
MRGWHHHAGKARHLFAVLGQNLHLGHIRFAILPRRVVETCIPSVHPLLCLDRCNRKRD